VLDAASSNPGDIAMRRLAFCFLPACLLALLASCSETLPAAAPSGSGDTCPLLDAGPPPVCPDGCRWNGTECRKDSGIIMPYNRPSSPQPAPPPPPPVPR
jgi:hypothetical protein